jgi:hypothetical protein
MKSNIIPYSNTQTINLDTYTTPTITNITSSIAQPASLFNINKVNTYSNKTYTSLSPIQNLQTYEPTLNNNTILNPTYNISTYKLPSTTTVQIPSTTNIIVPKKNTIVIPQPKQIVIPTYQRTKTPISTTNITKYNTVTIEPIKVVPRPNVIKINNVVPKPRVINILPVRTNPIVQTPNLTINKIQPILNYNTNLRPNVQNHFRANTISNFGNRTYTIRNYNFI